MVGVIRQLIVIGFTAVTLALIGCSGTADTPTTLPLPTPTTPPDFVSYTDESNSFMIEYPPELELVSQLMTTIEGELSDDETYIVFFGDAGSGFLVSIGVDGLPSELTVDEYAERSVRGIREILPSWKTNSQSRVVVGERGVVIMDSEYDPSDFAQGQGERRNIHLYTVQGKVGWSVKCSFPAEAFEHTETCDGIVRTFRILQ